MAGVYAFFTRLKKFKPALGEPGLFSKLAGVNAFGVVFTIVVCVPSLRESAIMGASI